ncbi:MAG: hypothetical protein QOG53_1367 [Frankiales bacterium]|jgi:diadenosine tetraphosphate (Ap4A) HIT family hydrolase|nr:hypothetical protein [Frankiales bacterium]
MSQPIDPKVAEVFADPMFPFTTDRTIKPLDPPVVPEPARLGEGQVDCYACAQPDDLFIWTDDDWRLRAYTPTPIRGAVLLETREHHESVSDLPQQLMTELGPIIARIERAILGIGDVARVHLNRWGDGGEHFHLWFLPRPLGALQLRGSALTMWMDVLPPLPDEDVDAALAAIVKGLG